MEIKKILVYTLMPVFKIEILESEGLVAEFILKNARCLHRSALFCICICICHVGRVSSMR